MNQQPISEAELIEIEHRAVCIESVKELLKSINLPYRLQDEFDDALERLNGLREDICRLIAQARTANLTGITESVNHGGRVSPKKKAR